jgi:hypothetical protein
MNTLTYVIVEATELANVIFDDVKQGSADKLRYSLDGTKFLLKYEGTQPSFLSGKQEYTHSEILAILATDEWTSDELI